MNGLPRSLLGRLRIDEVFVRFDGPRLFSALNEAGQRYMAVFAEETEDAEVFLYAPVSEDRYRAIRSGGLPLRAAFSDAQDGRVFVVTSSTEEADQRVEEWEAERLPSDWLPDDDATLSIPTLTLSRFEPSVLSVGRSRDPLADRLDG